VTTLIIVTKWKNSTVTQRQDVTHVNEHLLPISVYELQ